MKKILVVLFLIIFLSLAIYACWSFSAVVSIKNDQDKSDNINIEQNDKINKVGKIVLPTEYFDQSYFIYGSVNDNNWNYAVTSEVAYHSFPTKKIAIEGYNNNILQLPRVKTYEEIKEELRETDYGGITIIEDNIKNYGEIAQIFASGYYISKMDESDVDLDGEDEIILTLSLLMANHPPHKIVILKNSNIIFTYEGDYEGNKPLSIDSNTNNGFYIEWNQPDDFAEYGYCCSSGHTKTRFVYENNKFKPVWEQRITYVRVVEE